MYFYLGRIKWAKSLVCHLSELLDNVTAHHILKTLPTAQELSKRHKAAEATLQSYQDDMVAIWMNQQVCVSFFGDQQSLKKE